MAIILRQLAEGFLFGFFVVSVFLAIRRSW